MDKVVVQRASVFAVVLEGFVQGTLLFAALLLVESLALGRSARSALGAPTATIVRVYLVAGAAVGVVTGLGAWLIASVVRLRPARFSLAVLVCTCGTFFVFRSTPSHELAALTPRVVALLLAAVAVLLAGVWWSRRAAGAPLSRRGRSIRLVGLVVAVAACAITSAWIPLRDHRLPVRTTAPADAPNVLFVLIDALRADRLSCVGYGRPTTPFIDRLASKGTTFLNAYSHGNRTIIAMPSLFTSMYPSYARSNESGDWATPLPDSQTTMAEVFQGAGYTTFAMVSNPYLKRPFGLTQGFDHVEQFDSARFSLSVYRVLMALGCIDRPRYATGYAANATEVTDAAVAWLGRASSRAPFFCYVHYMDVHHPYLPPHAYEEKFSSGDWLSAIDPVALFAKTVELVKKKQRYPLSRNELTRLSDLYDASICYVDAEIARCVNTAQSSNGRPTIVIITSDHGDEFQEHGNLYHTNLAIEELIRVPLIVWRSDQVGSGRRVEDLVRHIDLLPTLAEWIHAPLPPRAVGRSLTPLIDGSGESNARASIAEGDFCSAVVEPGWKVMRVDTTGVDALFDLSADPSAYRDVAAVHPDRYARMRQSLEQYFEGVPLPGTAAAAAVDEATLRQLKALGYIN